MTPRPLPIIQSASACRRSSLTTTGYGDITPYSDVARLTNTLGITPLRFLFLIVLVGTTVEVLTQRSRDEFRTNRWRQRVQDQTVVVGFGVIGRSAVQAILDQGTPAAQIVGLLLQYQTARTSLSSLDTFMATGQDRDPKQAYVEHNITNGSIVINIFVVMLN